MKLWKLGAALSLTAAFGLVACGDDSDSGTAAAGDLDYTCDITDTKAVIKQNAGAYSITMTHMIDEDGILTSKYEYGSGHADVCNGPEVAALVAEAEDADASCENNTLTIVTKEATTAEAFKVYLDGVTSVCEDPVKPSTEPTSSEDTNGDDEKEPLTTKDDPTSSADEPAPASSADEPAPTSSADEDVDEVSSSSIDWEALVETCTDGDSTELMGVTMVCQDGEWKSTAPKCSLANEGDTTTIAGMKVVCRGSEWTPEMSDCTEENEGDSAIVADMKLVCHDGEWAPELPECTEKNIGDTTSTTMLGLTVELECTEEGWSERSCTNGATKTETLMGIEMQMKCVDGSWKVDESAYQM